ncbi:hypothetical protein [Amycolatopsis vastitatis]|uniref:hypothetical protein n=1 Tax=Amycolatopsis vastitatis TaxID=1905142 RepID=UPI00142E2B10|nr:hypothetical protein [Amycolatopsis vastitatis]
MLAEDGNSGQRGRWGHEEQVAGCAGPGLSFEKVEEQDERGDGSDEGEPGDGSDRGDGERSAKPPETAVKGMMLTVAASIWMNMPVRRSMSSPKRFW